MSPSSSPPFPKSFPSTTAHPILPSPQHTSSLHLFAVPNGLIFYSMYLVWLLYLCLLNVSLRPPRSGPSLFHSPSTRLPSGTAAFLVRSPHSSRIPISPQHLPYRHRPPAICPSAPTLIPSHPRFRPERLLLWYLYVLLVLLVSQFLLNISLIVAGHPRYVHQRPHPSPSHP